VIEAQEQLLDLIEVDVGEQLLDLIEVDVEEQIKSHGIEKL